MTGPEALESFNSAARLVKEGKYEEARAISLLPSDRKVIEQRIEASANRNDTNNGGLSNAGSGTPLAAQGANHALPHQQRND